jgi:GntR family transcriptional regulator / MocR family aminotransferase
VPAFGSLRAKLEIDLDIVKVQFRGDFLYQLRGSSGAAEFLVALDRSGSETLTRQLERQLRDAVRSGTLRPGARLPSTRGLAAQLGVSRGLVVAAYTQLRAEGYLDLRQGAAPRVSPTASPAAPPRPEARDDLPRFNLRPDLPDYSAFPRDEWLRSYRRALKGAADQDLAYGDVRGVYALRLELAEYLGRVRGLVAEPEHTFVCGGFSQAIGLLARVLLADGARTIAVEDPSHVVIREIIDRTGLETVPIEVDADGIDVDALIRAAPDAVLVTPAHQFPTGVVLAPERRARLIEWAAQTGSLIVEDDYDAEFRYDRAPVGSLQGLAPDCVAYVGSTSKTLAPTLRLGWLLAPARLVRPLADEVLFSVIAPPRLQQLAFADFLVRGELDRHLRRMRLRYRRRRDVLVRSLARELPVVEVGGIAAGLHVVAIFPRSYSERRIVAEARKRHIGLYGLGEHRVRARRRPALLLGYAVAGEATIPAAIRELAAAVAAADADRLV